MRLVEKAITWWVLGFGAGYYVAAVGAAWARGWLP